ncbi:MAG: Ni/Fe hydrogenase subunit alpha [Candidatus Sericytochromatia bacterium]
MSESKRRVISVDYLARVEGEGALYIQLNGTELEAVELKIFEPPRFFEAFLRGRDYREAPDITSRICGICPIAYQMGAVQAMEAILGLQVSEPLRQLRRLIYCGEWIESHVLHIYMLHAPDFLGFPDAVALAKVAPEAVKRGLRLKKIGNTLMTLLGGREIHPINLKVGGFYRLPEKRELLALVPELEWALDAAYTTLEWVAGFDFPDFEREYEYVALKHPMEYAIHEGRLVSNRGLDIPVAEYEAHFEEEHVMRSTALHSVRTGHGAYFVGPMARYNLNFDQLSPGVKAAAERVGIAGSCHNPFKSILVRSLETIFALEESLRLIQAYQKPEAAYLSAPLKAGVGHGCTEAPRGICYHRYTIDVQGNILNAKIVPPTSQNQKTIEADLRHLLPLYLDKPDQELQYLCEQAIRNYDPCISCSTHFLKLEVARQ